MIDHKMAKLWAKMQMRRGNAGKVAEFGSFDSMAITKTWPNINVFDRDYILSQQ